MRSLARSNQHFRKANQKLPLGVSSNFRYWGDEGTIYVKRGKGARVWDIDDNEYIDYRLAYGPIILGYADQRVDEAAKQGMDVGGVFALSTELEYDVACRISKMVPAAELVRFSNSGTEAVMAALRIARSFTGKDGHVVMEGGYHGVFSEVMWYSEVEDWEPADGQPELLPYGDGVPAVTKRLFHPVPLNDANALEDLMKKKHEQIGAFLIEPIMGNCCAITARAQYMKDVREICDRYDVLLIVDEVKTGFRVAKGGVITSSGLLFVRSTLAISHFSLFNLHRSISGFCGKDSAGLLFVGFMSAMSHSHFFDVSVSDFGFGFGFGHLPGLLFAMYRLIMVNGSSSDVFGSNSEVGVQDSSIVSILCVRNGSYSPSACVHIALCPSRKLGLRSSASKCLPIGKNTCRGKSPPDEIINMTGLWRCPKARLFESRQIRSNCIASSAGLINKTKSPNPIKSDTGPE